MNTIKLNVIGELTSSAEGGSSSGGGGGEKLLHNEIGIFIYDQDRNLVTVEDWDSANNDKAVGVYLGTDVHSFVIAKEDVSPDKLAMWGGYGREVIGITSMYGKKAEAQLDFDGYNTCLKIFDQYGTQTIDSVYGVPAISACFNYNPRAYVPSAGEWQLLWNNKSAINNALNKIEGTIPTSSLWSSTPKLETYSQTRVGYFWSACYHCAGDCLSYNAPSYLLKVRPALIPLKK